MKTTLFYPIFNATQNIIPGLESCLAQDEKNTEIVVAMQIPEEELPSDSRKYLQDNGHIRISEGRCKNIAELMNKGISESGGEVFVYLPPNIRLDARYVSRVRALFQSNKNAGFAFTDYAEEYPSGKREVKVLRNFDGDITERANLGYVKCYTIAALQDVGMYGEQFNRAEEYDLRLRLSEKFELIRIPEPLYSVIISPEKEEEKRANVGASKLFFPGEGKYGGFSYLFYDKDEEQEIELAFERFQKRQGFYLSHENAKVQYPAGAHFTPMVSVIIPVFNREKFIGRALDSVLANDFVDFEIIVVDNGSTDRSIAVAEEYVAKHRGRIQLIKNTKNIIAYSLNLGVNAAKGKYISQLDSDDEYTPGTLASMVDYLENHSKCALAISYYDLIDENGTPLQEFGIIKHLEYSRNNIMRVDGAGAVRMWHRKVIKEFGGFNEDKFGHYGEDYDMVLRVSEKYDVGRVHEVLYRYRRHADNTDVTRDPEMKIVNKLRARHLAIERRKRINQRIARGKSPWE